MFRERNYRCYYKQQSLLVAISAAATTAASKTASTAPSAASSSTTTISLRLGFVDLYGTTFELLIVHFSDSFLSFFFSGHFYKTEAFCFASVFVHYYTDFCDLAILFKGLSQIAFNDLEI